MNIETVYIVKGKYKGQNWKSEMYLDAEDMNEKYQECQSNKDYNELKQYNVYIHYEEIGDDQIL